METKQTAVEFAVEKLEKFIPSGNQIAIFSILQQAKQMEKEQIMDAWNKGDYCIDLPDGSWEQKYKSAEQYYNETYNK